MVDLLLNNWIIGIVGGLISALLYSLISFIFKKFSKINDIKKANNEILNLLKPYVIDRGFPEIEIVEALIKATARKYNISSKQMFSISDLCEELIKEITESIYITYEKKNEYNQDLANYKKMIEAKNGGYFLTETLKINEQISILEKLSALLTITMSTVGSVLILSFTLKERLEKKSFNIKEAQKLFLISLFLLMVYLLVMLIIKHISRRERGRKR